MGEESLHQLIVVFSAGLGLLLVGGLNLLFGLRSTWSRLTVAGAGSIGCGLIPAAFGPPHLALWSTGAIAFGALSMALLGTRFVTTIIHTLFGLVRRPVVQAVALGAVGGFLMLISQIRYAQDEQSAIDRDMEWLADLGAEPPTRSKTGQPATTDLGRTLNLRAPVELRAVEELSRAEGRLLGDARYIARVLRVAPASDVSNCHGWVFAGGKYWVGPEDVEQVLADNGYQPVSDPRRGDVVIYRDSTNISHTAVVYSVAPNQEVLVEGKWGWMGVFVHRAGDSPYGTRYTYYRSTRQGHLVVGLGV
jgi:hypothetical protein